MALPLVMNTIGQNIKSKGTHAMRNVNSRCKHQKRHPKIKDDTYLRFLLIRCFVTFIGIIFEVMKTFF